MFCEWCIMKPVTTANETFVVDKRNFLTSGKRFLDLNILEVLCYTFVLENSGTICLATRVSQRQS